ncbi:MAG: alpha-L-glutamate ligase-like protein [Candidatus Omnitrophica bacterium]|nr:alpha-L-glutamate ligase-like protein [Candidatus Omnitrophota bacterium]
MLSDIGILGMNRRNADFTITRNPRKYYPLVDNKITTKELLESHGLPAPVLYFQIRHIFELKLLREITRLREFVIKPARGAAGRGILPIVDRVENKWKTSKGDLLTQEYVEYHISNILAGLYSLGGVDDDAFIEYYVRSHPVFNPISYHGVPDIRIILYMGIPVMAMLRLPTLKSGGKANLHQGAIGAGVSMQEGITLKGVYLGKLVDRHPDTGNSISGIRIPFWKTILEISAKTFNIFKLGYMGVDFVIDVLLGPLILELNARPGLNIQLANRDGLLTRLRGIDELMKSRCPEKLSPDERLEIFREMIKKIEGQYF